MTTNPDNSRAHAKIQWILDNADMGFFIITAPHRQQGRIAEMYKSNRVAMLDYSQTSGQLEFYDLDALVDDNPDCDIMFVLNMQIALREEMSMAHFNMSRDNIARKRRIWFFFMDKETDDRLAGFAFDVYAYVRMKVHFTPEPEEEIIALPLPELEEQHNVEEIRKTLARYKDMEERYMALPLDGTEDGQLLAAAVTLENIAALYKNYADYSNALRLLNRIMAIREKVLGEMHQDTAIACNNIAYANKYLNDTYSALPWYERALNINKEVLGDNHPSTADNYNNIAIIFSEQEDYTKAIEFHEKALGIYKEILGPENPKTAGVYSDIAFILNEQGEHSRALEMFENCLNIQEKILGPGHPDVALTYNNIAMVYVNKNEHTKALEFLLRALDVQENAYGINANHPHVEATCIGIAIIYLRHGDYSEALKWCVRAYKTSMHFVGHSHPGEGEYESILRRIYNALPHSQPFETWLAARMEE